MKKSMVKMTIWMPVQMKANLDKLSRITGLNLSDIIRRAIDSSIDAPVSSRAKTKGEKEDGPKNQDLQES